MKIFPVSDTANCKCQPGLEAKRSICYALLTHRALRSQLPYKSKESSMCLVYPNCSDTSPNKTVLRTGKKLQFLSFWPKGSYCPFAFTRQRYHISQMQFPNVRKIPSVWLLWTCFNLNDVTTEQQRKRTPTQAMMRPSLGPGR